MKPLSIPAEEAEGPGTRVISLQDVHTPGPVQVIVHLVQVKEYHMEHCLPQGCKMLEKIDLEGGGPRTATHSEPVEEVVVGDGGGEAAIENHRHRLSTSPPRGPCRGSHLPLSGSGPPPTRPPSLRVLLPRIPSELGPPPSPISFAPSPTPPPLS